jgi:hypothetical protein
LAYFRQPFIINKSSKYTLLTIFFNVDNWVSFFTQLFYNSLINNIST